MASTTDTRMRVVVGVASAVVGAASAVILAVQAWRSSQAAKVEVEKAWAEAAEAAASEKVRADKAEESLRQLENRATDVQRLLSEKRSETTPESDRGALYAPIGYVKSCYTDICVTPRNAGLAPAAQASLQLDKNISPTTLEGLEENSHVWVIFVFHKNNNGDKVRRTWSEPGYTFRSKVRVPRNNVVQGDRRTGHKVGCLATRTPHRPNPIGLTLAKIERLSLKTREVWLSGSDLLDGTPILDIKPYVPIYDCPEVRNDGPARAAAFSDHTTFITRPVHYDAEALAAFEPGSTVAKRLRIYKGNPQRALAALTETLGCDLSRPASGREPLVPYQLQFDGFVAEYIVEGEDCRTRVLGVRPARRNEGGGRGQKNTGQAAATLT